LGSILPPTGDKYEIAEKAHIDLKAILDDKKTADGTELFTLAKLNLAEVDSKKAKTSPLNIEAKIKAVAEKKAAKETAEKDKKEFIDTYKATDTTFTAAEFTQIKDQQLIKAEYPAFVGYKISNLYDFFMVFVVLCGIASVILFLLTPVLRKMMNGVR